MKKSPIDPKQKFMNRSMLESICGRFEPFRRSHLELSLCMVPNRRLCACPDFGFRYLKVRAHSASMKLQIREREPPSALGFLSNKVMVLWAILVAATLFIGTNLPIIRSSLHTTNLTLVDWALALIVSFVATFWLELKEI